MPNRNLEALDLNLLLALHWILTERNVTAAAARLGLSQPATSRALSRLRDFFDDPILVKTGNTMSPTRLGEKLQSPIAHAVERMRDVLTVSDVFEPQQQTGEFRVSCKDYVGAMVFDAWRKTISLEAPGLDLQMVDPDPSNANELISGRVDLVMLPDTAIPDLPANLDVDQFVQKNILHQEFVCVVRKKHPRADKPMSLKRYLSEDHILVAPEGGPKGFSDAVLRKKGAERRIAYRSASFMLSLHLVQNSDAVLTVPEQVYDLAAEDLVKYKPPFPLPSQTLLSAWHPNWTHDARHKWVREKLFAQMKQPG